MNRKLIITSVTLLVLTVGLTWTVFGKGFYKLEAFANLPKEKQTLIIESMQKNREQNAALRDEIRSTNKAIIDALTAPDFYVAEFEVNVNKLLELHNEKFKALSFSVKELAPQFSQEERQVLSKIFMHGKHGHKYHANKYE
jgi:uncharacterized membrane protein